MSAISTNETFAIFQRVNPAGIQVEIFPTMQALAEQAIRSTMWEFADPVAQVQWLRQQLKALEKNADECGMHVPHEAPCTGCRHLVGGECAGPDMWHDFSCREAPPVPDDHQMALGLPQDTPAPQG